MQGSVVPTSMRRRVARGARSLRASPASCPMRSQCAKSMQRALVVVPTTQRAPRAASPRRYSRPPSPITSISPIMWTLVTGTKRCAPQNLPTSIWYSSARLAASPRPPPRMACSSGVNCMPAPLFALAGFRGEKLGVLVLGVFPLLGIRRRRALARDVGPFDRVLGIELEPIGGLRIGIGHDCLGRAFRFADPAVDALLRVEDGPV